MKKITRTIWGANLQTYQLPGIDFDTLASTTLNELYNVQSGVQPAANQMPVLGYLAIGLGAHVTAMGVNNIPLVKSLPHFCTDAALFKGMPFAMRPLSGDLSPAQMLNYRLRTVETFGGIQYACYYGKVIDKSAVTVVVNYNSVVNGVTTTRPYVPTTNNLEPQPPTISVGGTIQTSADYLTVSMVLDLSFTEADVIEYQNVAQIRLGSTDYAIISEMAVCTGLDKSVSGPAASGTINYTEVIACQVHSFVSDYISVGDTDQGFDYTINLGAGEPLLAAVAPATSSDTNVSS